MKNETEKKRLIIRYAKLLNKTNLSPLRSGNISIRHKKNNKEGFLITPSGLKYSELKLSDIVFVNLNGCYNKKKINRPQNGIFIEIFIKKKKNVTPSYMRTQNQQLL